MTKRFALIKVVSGIALLSGVVNLASALHPLMLLSLSLLGLLLWLRKQFTIRSRPPNWRSGGVKFALRVLAAFSNIQPTR